MSEGGRVSLSSTMTGMSFASFLALATLLSACGTIPLSTAAKLSTFDESEFASLDPQAIRVRVAVPADYTWDVESTKLGAKIDAGATTRSDAFRLARVSEQRGIRGNGAFDHGVAVSITTLRLADPSIPPFRALQQFVAAHKPEGIHLDVELSMITAPAGAKSVKVWVDVMLSERQGYFTLIDGGTARLDTKETYGTPRH